MADERLTSLLSFAPSRGRAARDGCSGRGGDGDRVSTPLSPPHSPSLWAKTAGGVVVGHYPLKNKVATSIGRPEEPPPPPFTPDAMAAVRLQGILSRAGGSARWTFKSGTYIDSAPASSAGTKKFGPFCVALQQHTLHTHLCTTCGAAGARPRHSWRVKIRTPPDAATYPPLRV